MIDRSDRSPGAFDVEFNYDRILWETGDLSDGTNGLGGSSARAGFSDGTVNDLELSGSGVNSGFLDSNPATGLINKSRNSTVLGRYVFEFPIQARVTSVVYEQIDTTDLPIDRNPNVGDGRRIFSDKKDAGDTVDRRKIRVKAQYGENTAGVMIYFRNFDLDDPSANAAPIDAEPTLNAGDDNNGNVDGTTNTRAGQLSSKNSRDCRGFSKGLACPTDATGIATVDFTVTRQPGDNFTVAASANETYVTNLTLAADGINLKDTSNTPTPATIPAPGSNACATSSVRACRADMLTVWRRLHIEVDSMGYVSSNSVTGTIAIGIRSSNISPLTLPLSINTLEPNRFENGRLVIGTTSYKLINSDINATPPVDANTNNSVTIINPGNFTVRFGDSFTLYDDDDFDDGDGANLDGDTLPFPGEDVTRPDTTMMQSNDIPCSATLDTFCNSFTPAYIKPYYNLSGSNEDIPFSLNTPETDRTNIYNNYFNNQVNARDDFWAVYLLGVYQPDVSEDSDPDEGEALYGQTDSLQGIGAFVYEELSRPTEYEDLDNPVIRPPGIPLWRNRPIANKYTATHEIGHLLNGDHDDCDGIGMCNTSTNDSGLMAGSSFRIRKIFTNTTLSKMRKVIRP